EGEGTQSLDINWGNFSFAPVIQANGAKTPQTMSSLPGSPNDVIFKDEANDSFIAKSIGNRGIILTYETKPGGFVAAGFSYDNFATTAIETFDLSSLTELDFGLRGDSVDVKMEIEDGLGQKAVAMLTGASPFGEKVWTIQTSIFTGIVDFSKVRFIVFIVEGENEQGALEVNRVQAPVVIPVPGPIAPSSDLTQGNVTILPDNPTTIAESSVDRISSELAELQYDVSGAQVHSRLIVSFDDLETPFVTESSDLSDLGFLVFGVSSAGATEVQLEIEDASGVRTVETLIQVKDQEQFYAIDLSNLHSPIDLTQVKVIRLIVSRGSVASPTGTVRLRAKGLDTTPPALTPELEAARRQMIAEQLQYFQAGIGIDPDTHLPFDQIENGITRKFTTLTDIGFYVQILGEVVRGSLDNGMTREQALQELQIVLAKLTQMQTNDGMGGLLPTVYDMPPTLSVFGPSPTAPMITFGDNANLSQSIAVMVGAMESLRSISEDGKILAQNVINAAELFLNNQEEGYREFYNANVIIDAENGNVLSKRFYAVYYTAAFNEHPANSFDGSLDRLANEFRSGVAFVIARYGLEPYAWNGLDVVTKAYQDQFGNSVTNLVPYDGGAFQIFWPLLWSNEQDQASMKAALTNYLYTAADFSNHNQLPGFVSASAVPEGGYQGKIGIPGASETTEPLLSNVASIYSLASAYALNPTLVVSWLKAIFEQYPELIVPNRGFVDALRSSTEFADVFNTIDQGSTVLGLLGSGGDFMETYLKNRNLTNSYQSLYNSLSLGIQQVLLNPLGPPDEFPANSFAVLNHVEFEGALGDASCFNSSCVDTTVFGTRIRYSGLNNSTFAGHFWKLDETIDATNRELVISISDIGPDVPSDSLVIELKDENDQVIVALDAFTISNLNPQLLGQVDGVETLVLDLSKLSVPNLDKVRFVNLFLDPQSTGPSVDFFVHQIVFRQFPSQIPPAFAVVTAPATMDQNQILNFNVLQLQAQGRLAFSTVAINNVDFSAEKVVFGFLSNRRLRKIKVELEDENERKTSGYITGIDVGASYYEFLKEYVPADIDLSKIQRINIIIDSTALEGDTTFDDLSVEMSLTTT
ncbi:MAG: hypothetical protein HY351_03730, partial [Candidatus Omnitrophica bacterium]|nr:hypothetical protein [Candidatus Omnitrophota bacterium]